MCGFPGVSSAEPKEILGLLPTSRLVTSDRVEVRDDRAPLNTLMLGDRAKDCSERSEPEGIMIWNCDSVVSRIAGFQDDVATHLVYPSSTASFGIGGQRGERRKRPEGSSCHQENFVTDKVKANSLGPWPIKKERRGRLQHVFAQFVPRVPLGEDAFREAFGGVPAIGFLDHLKHQLISHTAMIRHEFA